jgi:hypothetical protein
MSDKTPAGWTPLTIEQWRQVPRADHTSLFSREEVEAALRLLAPPDEAAEIVRVLYSESGEPGTIFFYGELLTALASLSDSAAERVRSVSVEGENADNEMQ